MRCRSTESFKTYGKRLQIRGTTIYGGVNQNRQIKCTASGVDRDRRHPRTVAGSLIRAKSISTSSSTVVLDEADRMLDMGFIPDIRKIMSALPKERQTPVVLGDLLPCGRGTASEFLSSPKMIEVGPRSTPVDTVRQVVHDVPESRRTDLLVHLLQSESLDTVLVFVRTRHGADRVAKKLGQAGIQAMTIHSSRTQSQRLRALDHSRTGS